MRTYQAVQQVGTVPGGGGFRVTTADGTLLTRRTLIAATGCFGAPHVPALPGNFRGRVLHAAGYRCPVPFAGQRVVVVGGGNSAVQIAVDLVGAARVSLTTRQALRWAPQRPLGRDVHWWLARTGKPSPPDGRTTGRCSPPPTTPWSGGPTAAPNTSTRSSWPPAIGRTSLTCVLSERSIRGAGLITGTACRPPFRGWDLWVSNYHRSISSATLRGVGRDAAFVLRHLTHHPAGTMPSPGVGVHNHHWKRSALGVNNRTG